MDDRIISCNGPGSYLEVVFPLMDRFLGTEMAREVQIYMIFLRNTN